MKNLETMTAKELKSIAKSLAVKGWWDMKKDELIVAIKDQQTMDEVIIDEPEETVEETNVNILAEKENESETTLDDQEKPKKNNHKRLIEYNGEVKTLTAWAKELGIRHQTLYNRIVMKGMDPIEALEMPLKKSKQEEVTNA